MPTSVRITVLLADDHHLVRRGFRRILEDDPELTVVGEASDGDEAVRMAAELQPAVVVMDAAMPVTSGLVATRRIVEHRPGTAVLMLSMHAEATLVSQALAAGARGREVEVERRLQDVAAGLRGERHHGLSPREMEVLHLICQGQSNRAIADTLDLSVNTVSVHRANIMSRLGVHKTAELVMYAIRHGLVGPL